MYINIVNFYIKCWATVYDYLEERYWSLPGNEQTLRNYLGYLSRTVRLQFKEGVRLLHHARVFTLDGESYRINK
ncbi:MAG: hypothetical protein PHU81_02710 [Acidobacteriota bacterium]|nr:hypothetical protein [Acidobacteriota bacterium]